MAQVFEAIMMICFGCSWPISVMKSYRSRTAKGKSVAFTYAIVLGYLCGIIGKIVSGNITYVLPLYIINTLMVATDICLYYRNRRLDTIADAAAERSR